GFGVSGGGGGGWRFGGDRWVAGWGRGRGQGAGGGAGDLGGGGPGGVPDAGRDFGRGGGEAVPVGPGSCACVRGPGQGPSRPFEGRCGVPGRFLGRGGDLLCGPRCRRTCSVGRGGGS